MFAVLLAMVWARRGQAVVLALLAMVAVSAAVAAPAYLRAAARAIAAGQVAVATPAERSLVVTATRPDRRGKLVTPDDHDVSLSDAGAGLTGLPGFSYVYAEEFNAASFGTDDRYRTLVVHRQDVCAQLTMVSGRCLIGESDVVIGEQTARRFKLAPGDPVPITYAVLKHNPLHDPPSWYEPAGRTERLLVAGVYRVTRPGDGYWGDRHYFAAAAPGLATEPAFIAGTTERAIDHGIVQQSVDGWADPGALNVDALPRLRTGLTALRATVAGMGSPVELTTGLPGLLARVDAGTSDGRAMVAVPAVLLVLLGCVTVFLAVGYGTDGRRPELAVVALRGARAGTRWWLAGGESVAAIAVGAIAGCLLGQLLVNLFFAVRYPGVGTDPGPDSLRWAPLAAGAVAITALLAQWRPLHTPVAQLLRRAPAVPSGVAAVAGLAVIALLAVVAEAQLRLTGGTLKGVGTLAPALIVLALAQLAARIVLPLVSALARRALRRGRLGTALAGFQLARRPGAAALFALVAAATAVAGFAACAIDVGAQGRRLQADLGTGAPQVLSVQAVDRNVLLGAVRAVDPAGGWAMAVATLPHDPGQPATLGVDSSRLATVPYLPGGGPTGKQLATALHPAAPEPVAIAGPAVSLDITATGLRPNKPVFMAAVVSSTTGLGAAVIAYDYLREGRHTYTREEPICRSGCHLTALQFGEGDGGLSVTGALELHGPGPGPVQLWRSAAGESLPATTDGVRIDLTPLNQQADGLVVRPADTPFPLPVAVAGPAPAGSVTGLDQHPLPVTTAARLKAVPATGAHARLVDLEYADRYAIDADTTSTEQVWLGTAAPADAAARLEAQGLVITGSTRAAEVRSRLDRQGPAVALGFYALAAALAVALGAGALILAASVDQRRRTEDLTALRTQGLSRRSLRRTTRATYPALVLVAVLAGTGVALLTWWLTGWALPLSTVDPHALQLPTWPEPTSMLLAAAAVLLVLAAIAYLANWGLSARDRRPSANPR